MIFKHKRMVTLALFSLIFTCCAFRAGAMTHESVGEMDISYNVEGNGRGDEARVTFGPISTYLQRDYHAQGTSSSLRSLVVAACKKNRAKTVVFDGIEYDYNQTAETLSVTRVGDSIYATAQQFVIVGLNLNNVDAIEERIREIQTATLRRVEEEGYRRSLEQRDPKAVLRLGQIEAEEKKKNPMVKFSSKPLRTVTFRGDIKRIGDDFCDAHDYNAGLPITIPPECDYFPQLETVDMSQSSISEICVGAFPGCTKLNNIVFPLGSVATKISVGAFEGCPVEQRLPINRMEDGRHDPRVPIGAARQSKVLLDCCIVS